MTDWASNISARCDGAACDDASLLQRFRDGDTAAFGALVGKYQDRVYNAIARMCGNASDAEELCQETFVKALEHAGGFRQASGFYTWLFRIAMNLAISHRRRSGRVKFRPLEPADPDGDSARRPELADERSADPSQAAHAADTRVRVARALAELDEEFRAVVVLRDIEDMDYQQVAEVLELPVGTVKSRLFRARSLLQQKLRDLMQ